MSNLPDTTTKKSPDLLAKDLSDQYQRDFTNITSIRNTWEAKEAMLLGVPNDSQSKTTKSKVFDPRLSTIVYERAARVAAQLPTGKVQALTKADTGKNMLMNLILKNYVYPNAKTQYDLLTKTRLLDVYSNVYGSFGWLVDYHIRSDYVGPDVSLIPIRNIIPQTGRHNDLDYLFVRSVVSRKWLLSRDTKTWKNIDVLLEKATTSVKDVQYQSYSETKYDSQNLLTDEKDDYEQIEIITRYEPDRWVTFSKDAKVILRDIKNPQNNGRIPVVMKHAFPVIDRFFGLGEFERGETLQLAINSLINLYLDGVKMSIFPPLKIYLPDLVAKTVSYEPAAKWILKNNNPNAITQMQFSPQGINSFNSTYQFLLAALSNQAGTTDTSITQNADITQGKTPQALRMVNDRENARDNWDRFMLEKSLEETFERFVELISTRQEKPIKLNLFEEEIKLIQQTNPDLGEMYESGKYGELIVKPTDVNDTKYRYFIDAGTSMKEDDQQQNAVLTQLLQTLMTIPNAMQQAMWTGKILLGNETLNVAEVFRRLIQTSGVGQADKIVSEATPEDQQAFANFFETMRKPYAPQPQVNVRVNADANTPQGAAILANENLVPPEELAQMPMQGPVIEDQNIPPTNFFQPPGGDPNQQRQQMQEQQQPMQQGQQPQVNFEDPKFQALLHGANKDAVNQILSELGGMTNGNGNSVQ